VHGPETTRVWLLGPGGPSEPRCRLSYLACVEGDGERFVLAYSRDVDWLIVAAAIAGVIAVPIGVWQLWVAISDRRDTRRVGRPEGTGAAATGGLSVTAPLGRLPDEVRGRDELVAELRRSLSRLQRRQRVWVLAGMGGLESPRSR
jgi:hypothetical protein